MTKLHGSVVEKDRDSGGGRADDAAGQIADRAHDDRQCLGLGAVGDDRAPRVKGIAKELGQAQADS